MNNRLKEFRTQKELTQEALATEVGVSRQTIIAIEKSKFVPSVRLALQLAAVLGVSVEDMFLLGKVQGGK